MRPPLPDMVAAARAELARQAQLGPGLNGPIIRGIGMILELVARDWDSATPDAVARITELKTLLERGSALGPSALSATLAAVVLGAELSIDLRLSQLAAIYDRLAEAMIELQAWLENESVPAAIILARDIDAHIMAVVETHILAGSAPW